VFFANSAFQKGIMMRMSSTALAVFQKSKRPLSQWNENLNAYSLICGHLEIGESFRECCEREIIEELECQASQIQLATIPLTILRFGEFSNSAGEETDYGLRTTNGTSLLPGWIKTFC